MHLGEEGGIEDDIGDGACFLIPTRALGFGGPLYGRGFADSFLVE